MGDIAVLPRTATETGWDHESPGHAASIGLWLSDRTEPTAAWAARQPWRREVRWDVPKGPDTTVWLLAYVVCYGSDGLVAKVHALNPYVRMSRGDSFAVTHGPGVR